MKKSTYIFGKIGEKVAQDYLLKKGYQILTTNFRLRQGEIDIIAAKNKTLVFVEVKLKNNFSPGLPEEMITPKKVAKIKKMAEYFLFLNPKIKNKYDLYRIDAICLVLDSLNQIKKINHWKNIDNQ